MTYNAPTLKYLLSDKCSHPVSTLTSTVEEVQNNLDHIYQTIEELKKLCNTQPIAKPLDAELSDVDLLVNDALVAEIAGLIKR